MKDYINIMEKILLTEMPRFTGKSVGDNNYIFLIKNKKDNEVLGNEIQFLPNGLRVMYFENPNHEDDTALIWLGDEDDIPIIASLNLLNKFPAIQSVGKQTGSSIYASDFYMKIVDTFGKLLFSGELVSSDAVKMWKNMVKRGLNIFVYDPANSTKYESISDPDLLDKYIGSTKEYENYRFVLSKNATITESIIQLFEMYRMHYLINHKV